VVGARAGILVLAVCAACAAADEARPSVETDAVEAPGHAAPAGVVSAERGPTRASREAARAAPEPEPVAATPVVVRLALYGITAAEGEDGHGRVVPAPYPVALDLTRDDGWPGRALDPVLHFGSLRFVRYEHVDPLVLRYVAADRNALPGDAEIAIQWGEDTASRLPVTRELTGGSGDVAP
jgi:hypothetical protein